MRHLYRHKLFYDVLIKCHDSLEKNGVRWELGKKDLEKIVDKKGFEAAPISGCISPCHLVPVVLECAGPDKPDYVNEYRLLLIDPKTGRQSAGHPVHVLPAGVIMPFVASSDAGLIAVVTEEYQPHPILHVLNVKTGAWKRCRLDDSFLGLNIAGFCNNSTEVLCCDFNRILAIKIDGSGDIRRIFQLRKIGSFSGWPAID